MSSVSRRRIVWLAIAALTSWGRRCAAIGTQPPARAAAAMTATSGPVGTHAHWRTGTYLAVAGMLAAMLHVGVPASSRHRRSESAVEHHHTSVALQRWPGRHPDPRVVFARQRLPRLQRRAIGSERRRNDQQAGANAGDREGQNDQG